MKKVLFLLLTSVLLLASPSYATVVEGGDIVSMSASLDATTSSRKVVAVVWVSEAGDEIGATDGFLLTDTAGEVIASSEATALTDQFILVLPKPISVSGLIAAQLDAGKLFIYGSRR